MIIAMLLAAAAVPTPEAEALGRRLAATGVVGVPGQAPVAAIAGQVGEVGQPGQQGR